MRRRQRQPWCPGEVSLPRIAAGELGYCVVPVPNQPATIYAGTLDRIPPVVKCTNRRVFPARIGPRRDFQPLWECVNSAERGSGRRAESRALRLGIFRPGARLPEVAPLRAGELFFRFECTPPADGRILPRSALTKSSRPRWTSLAGKAASEMECTNRSPCPRRRTRKVGSAPAAIPAAGGSPVSASSRGSRGRLCRPNPWPAFSNGLSGTVGSVDYPELRSTDAMGIRR